MRPDESTEAAPPAEGRTGRGGTAAFAMLWLAATGAGLFLFRDHALAYSPVTHALMTLMLSLLAGLVVAGTVFLFGCIIARLHKSARGKRAGRTG